MLPAQPGLIGEGDVQDLVHAKILDGIRLPVVGEQIIILILPRQCPGADVIYLSAVAQDLLLFHVPGKVLEGDGAVFLHGPVQMIYRVIDALVHGLHAARHKYLARQLSCLVGAGQPLQLADQLRAFFVGDEFGGLHRVHQQFQLCQLQCPGCYIVSGTASRGHLDIHPPFPQGGQIAVDAFPLGRYPVFLPQNPQDVRHGQRVVLVGALVQQTSQVEQLRFLTFVFRHNFSQRIVFCGLSPVYRTHKRVY